MNFLLDVDWRCGHFQWRPILYILASPDKLRVKVRVSRIAQKLQVFFVIRQNALQLCRRDVPPLVSRMGIVINFCALRLLAFWRQRH
ncbi:hypothetical protein MAXJ12_24797 [Mesorhizobium alhagi CCNWXJ12-2]|uniref:Uncharacterized protein n=1 Tax=Mesorhizobium alhagi CCNWXJ12-2 TaxID=1107882 RepID=H0HXR0_9HYPH|nr:hypothetical protein MAXJ12_24797 [Mesorhizobium alhagi CCNWXJ12-2]